MNQSNITRFSQKLCKIFNFSREIHGATVLWMMAAAPSYAELVISAGSGSYWYQAAAATGAVDQFLGRNDGEDSTGGGEGGTGGGLSSSVDANGPLRLKHHSAVALTWRHAVPLSTRVDLVGGVRLEYGRTRWFVKDGIDVLRDDLTAKLHHLSISPTLALRRSLPDLGSWQMDVTGGLGAQALVARTHITSALLDLRRTEHFNDHFVFMRLGVAHADTPSNRAVIDLQWRDSTDFNLRFGLEHAF